MKTHYLMLRAKFNVVCKRLHILIPRQLPKPARQGRSRHGGAQVRTNTLLVLLHQHRRQGPTCTHTQTHTHIYGHTLGRKNWFAAENGMRGEREMFQWVNAYLRKREREIKITKPRVFCLLWYLALSSLSLSLFGWSTQTRYKFKNCLFSLSLCPSSLSSL